ncbi:S-adenosyl-L-methionine-dependent methyltransferase [Pyronema domesticum]|uniref:Similar to Demethylmenaquinone methyltransferase acc. no. Q9RRT0 n=1 Tax=Pyronema omphalodes (strain CBS 100304) TaxID=1076935 RepID=U4L0Z4_PYROM|nr:S-adenosyl-L-methionine-dependent methyltransferase [Pyronema domesticum]CCX09307.1 Similar to Demethylmenaquinone methyltransferase; acc. no. Q9RRT0 [Pyronema omphalodes CBS 100304]
MLEVDPTILAKPEDDAYASSGYDTSTASLSSSIYQYVFENGRRYHSYYGTDKYLLPIDEKEQDRLDLHHEIMRLIWHKELHEAPLHQPHRILDIGTGTGIWAVDMADQYPMAQVIGTDLSPIQPNWVPANCQFQVDDAMMEWAFQSNSFDFIHARNLSSGVSSWDHLMSQMKRCTKPGGYVELCEMEIKCHCNDGSMKPDHGMKVYVDYLRESLEKIGRPPVDGRFMTKLLEGAGFEDVRAVKANQPVGPWAKGAKVKQVGAMALLQSTETIYESYGMALFTRVLGMDQEKVQEICDAARRDGRNKNYHVYCVYYRVYGRKPIA